MTAWRTVIAEPPEQTEMDYLVKAHVLSAALVPGGISTQKQEEEWLETPDGALTPPLNLDMLRTLSELDPIRDDCVRAVVRNTVGLGYELQVEEGREQDLADPTESINSATAQLEAAAARDTKLERPSFATLLEALKTDEEEVGNAYIEVSRDKRTGSIDGIFRAPGAEVRRKDDRTGYLILDRANPERKVEFENFGAKVVYGDDGKPTNSLAKGARWERNELLAFRHFTSSSQDYGLPRDRAMVLEYLAAKLSTESNVSFFASGGTLPSVLFVQGTESERGAQGGRIDVEVPPEVVRAIGDTMRSDAGAQKRIAIIPLPAGIQAQHVELGSFSDRDVGYQSFRDSTGRRIIASFGLQPIFIPAVPDEGRYTAEVQRALCLEATFDPDQRRWERRLTDTICKDLGYPELQLKLRRLAVEADAARRDSSDKLAEQGNITRREHRAAHGYAPLPEGGDTGIPDGWNDELVDTGQPPGAENRRQFGDDNRGLRPGLAQRQRRSTPEELAAQRENGS